MREPPSGRNDRKQNGRLRKLGYFIKIPITENIGVCDTPNESSWGVKDIHVVKGDKVAPWFVKLSKTKWLTCYILLKLRITRYREKGHKFQLQIN